MSSQVGVINNALDLIGQDPITSIAQNTKGARLMSRLFEDVRRSLLEEGSYGFARRRAELAAAATAPAFDYSFYYPVPDRWLRMVQINDKIAAQHLVGVYYSASTVPSPNLAEYSIEANDDGVTCIACNYSGPLRIVYIEDVTDVQRWSSTFSDYMSAELAFRAVNSMDVESNVKAFAQTHRDTARQRALSTSARMRAPARNAMSPVRAARFR